MSDIPLYEVIYQKLKEKIITRELMPGTRLPTEMELGREFNVSRITVTRALKELKLNNLIYRIKGSGTYVNDENKWAAVPGRSADSNLSIISLVLPFEGYFSNDFFRGIEDVARGNNFLVTFHNSSDNPETEKQIIEDLTIRGVRGIILYPVETAHNMDVYSRILINRFPFVLIDRKIHGLEATLVTTDNRKGFYGITSHLIELGHSKIVFAGTSVYSLSSEMERYYGFCDAHVKHGKPLLNKHLFTRDTLNDIPVDYRADEPLEYRQGNYFLDILENLKAEERPTAIAAVNDSVAEIIIKAALKRGIRIPGDYSVTGFDNLPFSSHLPVPLTTVAQPVYEIGHTAAEELFRIIRFPERKSRIHMIDSEIIIRDSTTRVD